MMLLSILILISGAFSAGASTDCAHLGELAVDQCIVFPAGEQAATFGASEAVAMSISCETVSGSTTWAINGFKNKKCTSTVNDDLYPIDISFLCDPGEEKECVCGADTDADDCYMTVSDYKDCDEDGKYEVEQDLLLQYSAIVGECVAVGDDNEEYDADFPKWKLTECNDNNNIYNAWTTTIYEDAACLIEYKEHDLDCSSLTSESVTCDVTADVKAGEYCGRFEGHPLGVCSASGTFADDNSNTYYESSMYVCEDATTFKKVTYLSADCTGAEKNTEEVDCGMDHNCICDVAGGLNDGSTNACGYTLFSYSAQGPCTDLYHNISGNVEYTVILDEDMCTIDDENLNGVQYHCGNGANTPSDLTFTIFPGDVSCSGDTYCAHTRTVDCGYSAPATPISCNYYSNYPIGVCSKMITYIDPQGAESLTSTTYQCNNDGSIQTNVYNNLDCNATGLISSEACTECTTDDRGRETCDDCQGSCAAVTSSCKLAQVYQNLVCKLVADDSTAQDISSTELLVLDECQSIASKYRMDTCSGTVITQTVFEDDQCSDAREACSISIYEGDYGLDYEEHHSAVTSCVKKIGAGNGECGYIDQYPVDACVVAYTDNDGGVSFSAKYLCSNATGDEYTISVYRSADCTGAVIHTEVETCSAEGIECNCGGTADECDVVTMRLTDTCLETETFLTVVMPDHCQKIEDVNDDWSLYVGIWCDETQEDGVAFAIYEDSECKKQANALRYKDANDCTHYFEWEGVCGAWDDGRGFVQSLGNANNVQVVFATAFVAILALFL